MQSLCEQRGNDRQAPEKQKNLASYAMSADGMAEIRRIRINGNRNVMNISSQRSRQKETEKNSKL